MYELPNDKPLAARRADLAMETVSAPPARDTWPGRGGTGGPPARPDGGTHRSRPGWRRSLPHRGQTNGKPRRTVPRILTRALGAAMETTGRRFRGRPRAR